MDTPNPNPAPAETVSKADHDRIVSEKDATILELTEALKAAKATAKSGELTVKIGKETYGLTAPKFRHGGEILTAANLKDADETLVAELVAAGILTKKGK